MVNGATFDGEERRNLGVILDGQGSKFLVNPLH